jgi:putative Mg2+ transporter-C (MgtC) family protein
MPQGWHTDADIIVRLLVAMVLAGLIGWDREHGGHPAGLRTNMLVGLAAALFTATGDLLLVHFQGYGSVVRSDPLRILQAIVLGISFLGSGVIFVAHNRDEVRGLTTAASIWTITGVGIIVGLRHYVLGVATTILVLVVLEVVRKVEAVASARKSR